MDKIFCGDNFEMKFVKWCNCSGQSPADADLNLLDIARKIEHYGMRLYPAKVMLSADCGNAVFDYTVTHYLFCVLIHYQHY